MAQHLDDRKDAAEVARQAAAERGAGRMVLPGSSKLPQLRLRRPGAARRSRVAARRPSLASAVPRRGEPLASLRHASRCDRWRPHGLGDRGGVRALGRRRDGRRGRRRSARSARARRSRSRWTAACARASSSEEDTPTALERLAVHRDARGHRGRRRRDRGVIEDERLKRELFRAARRAAARRPASSPPTPPRCRS